MSKKSAFSLIELSITVLIIGVVTIVALNGKSLVVKANCVVSSLGSKTITNNLDNPNALTKNRSTAYENCISTGGVVPLQCSGTCTSCKTYLATNPGSPSGTYTIDPDGDGTGLSPFSAYCDMTTDDGGWTKILHYKDTAYTPNTGAVDLTGISTENTASISGFAKLSDAQINAIGGSGVTKTYRISGDKTMKKYYNKSNGVWNDTARGFGLPNGSRQVCETSAGIASCSWVTNGSSYLDSLAEGLAGNDCDRYFADYSPTINCYTTSSSTQRCFSAGFCGPVAPIINKLEIYLRE